MSSYDDRLAEILGRLKLFGIRDQLDSLLDEASRSDLDMRQTLTLLLGREIARKDARRIEMALKLAHFPMVREQHQRIVGRIEIKPKRYPALSLQTADRSRA